MAVTKKVSQRQSVRFSQNWNQKLVCDSFSTIRIRNVKKYVKGNRYMIMLKIPGSGYFEEVGIAILVASSMFTLSNLSDTMSFLDADMNNVEMKNMLNKMYKDKNQYVENLMFNMLVFKWESRAINFFEKVLPNYFAQKLV